MVEIAYCLANVEEEVWVPETAFLLEDLSFELRVALKVALVF